MSGLGSGLVHSWDQAHYHHPQLLWCTEHLLYWEGQGKVHALDPPTLPWLSFSGPPIHPYPHLCSLMKAQPWKRNSACQRLHQIILNLEKVPEDKSVPSRGP